MILFLESHFTKQLNAKNSKITIIFSQRWRTILQKYALVFVGWFNLSISRVAFPNKIVATSISRLAWKAGSTIYKVCQVHSFRCYSSVALVHTSKTSRQFSTSFSSRAFSYCTALWLYFPRSETLSSTLRIPPSRAAQIASRLYLELSWKIVDISIMIH